MRLFVGIELTDEARVEALRARERLVETLTRQGVRFVRPEKLHLTLAFLGQVRDEKVDDLASALRSLSTLPQFALHLGELGCFPDMKRPKVVWLGLEGDLESAQQLATEISRTCKPLAPELDEKPFAAHITLARVNPGSKEVGRILAGLQLDIEPAKLQVESFLLLHSRPDGTYETLQRVQLGA